MIREAHYRVCVSHINPLGIRSRRVEGNPERLVQTASKYLGLFRFAIGGKATKNLNLAGVTLSQKDITIGRRTQQSWIIQFACELFDFKAGRSLGPCIGWPPDHIGPVVH